MLTWRDLQQMLVNGREPVAQPGLAAAHKSREEIIEMGDFRINLADRTATLRAQKLSLTWEEFDTLVYLVNHPQRLITRQTTLTTNSAEGWPHLANFLRNLLSLRDKLDAAGEGKHYLRTEPWIIYRFEPNPSTMI